MKLATPIASCSGEKMSSSIAGSMEKKKCAHTISRASYKIKYSKKMDAL